jgi:hypothetical protein
MSFLVLLPAGPLLEQALTSPVRVRHWTHIYEANNPTEDRQVKRI